MKDEDVDIEARLERLARATDDVRPRPDFAARVARAIEAERDRSGVIDELRRPARRLLPALALAAAVSLVWAVQSDDALDEALLAYPDDTMELEW